MSRSARETKVLQPRGPRTAPVHDDQAQLVHALGPLAGRRVQVQHGAVLGRDDTCDVPVDDEGTSRTHARLDYDPKEGFFIQDLDSRNGTFVNGVSVGRSRLAFGDKVAIGAHTVFLFTRNTPLDDQVIQAQKLQMLGELAGGIVHDFNNILAAFSVGMDILRDMCGGEPQVDDCLRDLEDAAARGADLTGQLLGFARGGAAQLDRIDLSQVSSDGVRLLRRMVPRTVAIRTKIEPNVGVYGSASQVLQIIVNLAVNSADAMPDGGEITVRVARAGEHALLQVSDNGEGMDQPTLERALDPFFTTKPRGHGTGLGLATVDRVVREHRGTLTLSSEPGRGTTVTAQLPYEEIQPREDRRDDQAPLLPAGTVVLLVDDDSVVSALTVRMLQAAGAEVVVSDDGLDGLEVFRDHSERLSAVMLDLDLPRLSGEEVFEVMHEIEPEIPVIIASGFLDDERAQRLRSAGVAGFVSKPFRRASLLSMLVGCMRYPSQAEAGEEASDPQHWSETTAPGLPPVSEGEVDIDPELRALEDASPGFLAEVARLYLSQAPQLIASIVAASEPDERASSAHTLKGSSLSLGVSTVGKIAAAIEAAARTGGPTDHWLDPLRQAYDAIEPKLRALTGDRAP